MKYRYWILAGLLALTPLAVRAQPPVSGAVVQAGSVRATAHREKKHKDRDFRQPRTVPMTSWSH